MNLKHPLVRLPLRYGTVAGVFASGALAVLYYAGVHPFLVAPFFDFRILLFALFLFFLLREARTELGDQLFFFQAMGGAMAFLSVFSVITFVFVLAFAYADDSFLADFIDLFRKQAATFSEDVIARIGREKYEESLQALDETTPLDLALLYLRQSVTIWFFVSIIISVTLRKQSKPS
jgi:hypothetical protein